MELTAESIYGFTNALLLNRFDNPQPTPAFHMELWGLCCNPHSHVAVAAPRGHAKSTAVTHSYVLASVLFRTRKYVLLVSDTEGQAIQFLADIKRELFENEELIKLFGIGKIIKDTEADIICQFVDGKQFRITAKGSEQKIRGLKWRNKRPDLIVGDDLENDEIVLNEERRAKFRNWFFSALLPAGGDDCLVRIVGTILHMDALLERLLGDSEWLSRRYEAHNSDFSEILWPEKFPRKRLEAIRRRYVNQGNPEGYAQEYLNKPIDEATAYFRKSDFLPIDDYSEFLEFYSAADLAISEKDGRAFTVMLTAGVNSKGRLKVVDVRRFRGDSLQIIEEIFSVHNRYRPEAFIIESENIAKSIGPILEREMRERRIFINIEKVIASVDKIKRARSIQARMRAGGVEFDMEAEWFPDLQTELLQFPRGLYKDQVDCLAHIGMHLDKINDAPTIEELEEEEWEAEEQASMFMYDGRDSLTGY
jgi:predicted phage terminase large subunit-like protein